MKHTAETKAKLSLIRKTWLAENPDKHPWKLAKNRDRRSVPTEKVKAFLAAKGMTFVEELSPIPGRAFSVDIAFPDIKYGIEVNGNQHYEADGSLKPYYADRHRVFEDHGWTLLELHYSLCFNDDLLEKVITLRHVADYTSFIAKHLEQKSAMKKRQSSGVPRGAAIRTRNLEKWEPSKELIANIDVSKFGWVGEVSKILGITPQHVNRWMKLHLPETYAIAFKRRKGHDVKTQENGC